MSSSSTPPPNLAELRRTVERGREVRARLLKSTTNHADPTDLSALQSAATEAVAGFTAIAVGLGPVNKHNVAVELAQALQLQGDHIFLSNFVAIRVGRGKDASKAAVAKLESAGAVVAAAVQASQGPNAPTIAGAKQALGATLDDIFNSIFMVQSSTPGAAVDALNTLRRSFGLKASAAKAKLYLVTAARKFFGVLDSPLGDLYVEHKTIVEIGGSVRTSEEHAAIIQTSWSMWAWLKAPANASTAQVDQWLNPRGGSTAAVFMLLAAIAVAFGREACARGKLPVNPAPEQKAVVNAALVAARQAASAALIARSTGSVVRLTHDNIALQARLGMLNGVAETETARGELKVCEQLIKDSPKEVSSHVKELFNAAQRMTNTGEIDPESEDSPSLRPLTSMPISEDNAEEGDGASEGDDKAQAHVEADAKESDKGGAQNEPKSESST